MEPLRIHLFGGFLLQLGDTPLPPIPSRMARSLFAYLVANRDRSHTRDLLAGTFWPEHPESRARRRLSHTLWQVQSVLDEVSDKPFILVTPNTLQFNADAGYWLDVEEFDRSVAPLDKPEGPGRSDLGALRHAVDLYRGDLLAGFYDDWILMDQEVLRERYLAALTELVRLTRASRNNEEALKYARRIVLADPLREDAHRDVMRLCYILDRFNEAIQQYERCKSILDEELGTDPDPETEDLYWSILERREKGERAFAAGPRSPLFVSQPPLVGRVHERAAVISKIEDMLAGDGGVVVIEGVAGVGKSRLIHELSNDAHLYGLSVLRGSCVEVETLRPYDVLRVALEAELSLHRAQQLEQRVDGVWLREVSRIVPSLAEMLPGLPARERLRSPEEAGRMREALARTFIALGDINPTVLFLDDMQWADEDTLAALATLAEAAGGSGLLLCLSFRGDEARARPEAWKLLRRIAAGPGASHLELGPLNLHETSELIRRSMDWPGSSPDFDAGLFHETGGNAFFLLETLRALEETDAFDSGDGPPDSAAILSDLPLASGVAEVIGSRLDELPPRAEHVLAAAALFSGQATSRALATVSSLPVAEVLDLIDAALEARLLSFGGGVYRFAHQQIQKVASTRLDSEAIGAMHANSAALLELEAPDSVEALAHHYTEAGILDRAVSYLAKAGERAVGLDAYETAARHHAAAVELAAEVDLGPRTRFELLAAQERVLDVLGRRAEQKRVLERLLTLAPDPASRAEAQRRLGWLLAHTDRFEDAEKAARAALVLAEDLGDAEEQASALTALGMAMSWSGRAPDAVNYLRAALDIQVAGSTGQAESRTFLGNVLTVLQEYGQATAELEAARLIYREAGDRRGEAEVLGVLGIVHMEQGDVADAEHYYGDALEVCREIGYRHGEAVNLVNLGNIYRYQSRISDALEAYETSDEAFRVIGNSRGAAWVRANLASLEHSYLGEDTQAEENARMALDYFESIDHPHGTALGLDILGGIARRAGDGATARRHYERALLELRRTEHRWTEVSVRTALARLNLDEGRPEDAFAHIDAADKICEEAGMGDAAVTLRGMRGLALWASGDLPSALEAVADAAERIHAGIDQAHLIAYWHYQIALAVGDRRQAASASDRAHGLLHRSLQGLDEATRDRALRAIPEHRAIEEAWLAFNSKMETVRLPRLDVPTGRPLMPDEYVEVRWTVWEPSDAEASKPAAERRIRLLRLVREARAQGGAPTIDHLVEALGGSPATLGRDLAALRAAGEEIRTRGARRRRAPSAPEE